MIVSFPADAGLVTILDPADVEHSPWIPGQRRRLRLLAPGTWQQALAGVLAVSPGRPDDHPGHPAVEIAIYPDVVWLAARSLRMAST